MKIYFIRHGEAMDDINNSYGGWADDPLSEKGREQAQEAGNKFKEKNLKAEKILTSPLLRAKQTAEEMEKLLILTLKFFNI